jgi:hypothetical protein
LPIKKRFIAQEIEIRTRPVAGMFGVFAKRIFVPKLEDYEESKKKARCIAF